MNFLPLQPDQLRQFIDAETVFVALEQARRTASEVRGSMFWRTEKGRDYLVRASSQAAQKRLGSRNLETEGIFARFIQRKTEAELRVKTLQEAAERNRRVNLALRVGRCPNLLVSILDRFDRAGISEHFLTVGTHALYAYETAAGVRVMPGALATQDVDLLFDTRKRVSFMTRLAENDLSLIDILRKVDKTFAVKEDQLQTAVNATGFEVDVIRRTAKDGDPHPLRMSHKDDDFWAVQVDSGDTMVSSERFSQVIVSTDGSMARMTTFSPAAFVRLKRKLSTSPSRDPLKKSKDALQAEIVQELIETHMIEVRGKWPLAEPRNQTL